MNAMSLHAQVRVPAELVCANPEHVAAIWPVVAPRLRRAIQRTGLSAFVDIERDILAGRSLLWLALGEEGGRASIDAVAATRLELTEAGKVCVITACEGEHMRRWLPLLDGIENYAKAEGCCSVRIFGRKGWLRVLDGYRQAHAILDRELSE
jgi:hypothetical protein